MKFVKQSIAFAVAVVMTSCAAPPSAQPVAQPPAQLAVTSPLQPLSTSSPTASSASSSATDDLADTQWQLASFETISATTPVLTSTPLTLQFGADGRLSGQGGCNGFGGTYQAQGRAITLTNIVSTLRACVDDAATQQESRYLNALNAASTVVVATDQMTMALSGGADQLNFISAISTPLTGTATITPAVPITSAGLVPANGISIAYESFGAPDRETVLLIGGTGQQLIDWPIELVDELVQRGYRVVRFDNRDIGLSTKMTEAGLPDSDAITKALQEGKPAPIPYTLSDMADDAVGLLDALKIERAHIVGISMGGAIAQLVAIDHPTRTLSLTSIAADSGNPALPVVAKPEAFANLPPAPTGDDKDAFIAYQTQVNLVLSSPGYPTDEATWRERVTRSVARAYDPAALARQQTVSLVGHYESGSYRLNNLKNITAPTVVVQGDGDALMPVESARDIASRVPNADLKIVPGMGHEIPVALASTIADAITSVASRAKPVK